MRIKLKACPFCKGVGELRDLEEMARVVCLNCGGRTCDWNGTYRRESAVNAWNRRPKRVARIK